MSTRSAKLPSARTLASLAALAALLGARDAAAQERLTNAAVATVGPVFQSVSLGDPLAQPAIGGVAVNVESARQWSVPIVAIVPIGSRWTIDASGGWATGEVRLASPDVDGRDAYSLDGFTDFKVRLTGRLRGDNLLLTVGLNVPTGRTSLDDEQLAALAVLSAPALGFETPALGTGLGGTVGVVYARQLGGWAWAAGGSYELRATYNPYASAGAGLAQPDFAPGDAFRLSLAGDGLVGAHGMTVSLSVDAFTTGELTRPEFAGTVVPSRLGPIVTADWEMRIATTRLRELTVRALDRYRSRYTTGGVSQPGSDGNYLDVIARGVWPVGDRVGLLTGVNLRHQTGLEVDDTFATAGMFGGGATIGLLVPRGAFIVQPFARAMFGTMDTGPQSSGFSQFTIGIGFGTRR